jgi:hypothetical protein
MAAAKDPSHWLYRLSSEEWLAAADTELRHCAEALGRRSFRQGVTHARRAVGMAWNAALVVSYEDRYGRSYMDHVVALAVQKSLPVAVRDAALRLRDTPAAPPALVQLGKPDLAVLDAARIVVDYARSRAVTTN